MEPFDINTNSGKIVNSIINNLSDDCSTTNLVTFAPLDLNGRLRYPTSEEITCSIPPFLKKIDEFQPDMIICFGKIVYNEIKHIDKIKDKLFFKYHPSYIYIYKRKNIDNYINDILDTINTYKNTNVNSSIL